MLKGLRLPLLALVFASVLLIVAIVTRPDEASKAEPEAVQQTPATAQPEPSATTALAAAQPTNAPVTPEPDAPPPTVLVEGLVGQIRKLNPVLAVYNPVDRDITSLIFEGLTSTNDYGEIVPQLAERWTVAANGLEYVVVLRQDVLWQDGLPFTADDVVFTYGVLSDPLYPGPAELYAFWRTVEVEKLNEFMVRFRLTQPLASFPDYLRMGLLPAHVLQGFPVDELPSHPFNLSPIGTGPYQLETLTASGGQIDGIQLRVAPVYRQRPEGQTGFALDRLVFRTYPDTQSVLDAYLRGEVNSVGNVPDEVSVTVDALPGLSVYTGLQPHVGVLIYNWERDSVGFVRNPRARLALAQAVDRHAVVTAHLTGRAIPADSPLLPGSWAYSAAVEWPAYNIDQAQATLETSNVVFADEVEPTVAAPDTETPPEGAEEAPTEEAGDTAELNALDLPQRTLVILTVNDPALVAVAEDVAVNWRVLGFEVTVEPVDVPTLHARLSTKEFDAALVELSFEPNADPDPYVFWHQGQSEDGQNFGGMDDRRISEALEMARRDPTGVNRAVHYQRFQALFAERVPALVLYYPLYTYAVDARLQGVQLGFLSTASDRFRHIQDWQFAE